MLAGVLLLVAGTAVAQDRPYPPFYRGTNVFRQVIADAGTHPSPVPVTGLILPHHLLAADLIAQGLAVLPPPRRVLLLSPDHYRRSHTPVAVTRRDFETVLGPVPVDRAGAESLLVDPRVSESSLFSHEHGVRAILPFLAARFPGTPVLPLALRPDSRPGDWRALIEMLAGIVQPGDVVIQSTDFSHYLKLADALDRDRETMAVIRNQDPEGVARLRQPDHVDSPGALYVQLALQRDLFDNAPRILHHRTAQGYADGPLDDITTYLVVMFAAP